MPGKNSLTELVIFYLPRYLHPRTLEPEIQATDSAEQRAYSHSLSAPRAGTLANGVSGREENTLKAAAVSRRRERPKGAGIEEPGVAAG